MAWNWNGEKLIDIHKMAFRMIYSDFDLYVHMVTEKIEREREKSVRWISIRCFGKCVESHHSFGVYFFISTSTLCVRALVL